MPRRKKKKIQQPRILKSGKIIQPHLIKARYLRKSLLQRVKTEELKLTTPTIKELEKWLSHNHFICVYCFRELPLDEVTCDHVIPLARKGDNCLENLAYCCITCNRMKGNLTDLELRSLLELMKNWDNEGQLILLRRLKQGNMIFAK